MLLRTDLFRCADLEELLRIQNRMNRRLSYWEARHDGYSHTSEIALGKSNFTLKIEVYEEQQYPDYN